MSLYRKHRPQKFKDLIGQDHVKTTLSNALQSGKFSHAYLFCGPKGSGKTTTARLLAKALNCTGRVLGLDAFEPCNKCSSCKEITLGSSMDVIEIDAASNRGIDEIRNLREKIRFAPTASKFKVYVIDECHMLTKEAFNALLKTLEEPPGHVIFVLATTELHKVPATILSRVQAFDFKKARQNEILGKLQKIVKAEQINIEEGALQLISHLAFGAFRDAETMLDQVATLQQTNPQITLKHVQEILGQTTQAEVWDLVEYLAKKDRAKAIKLIEEVYFEGKDLENFIVEIIGVLRRFILFKSGLISELMVDEEESQKIAQISEYFSLAEIVQIIEKLMVAVNKVKTSVLGQLPLEMVVFELTKDSLLPTACSLPSEVAENIKAVSRKSETISQPLKSEPIIQKKDVEKPSTDNGQLSVHWPAIVKQAKSHNNALAALLKDASFAGTEDGMVILSVKYKFHADQICNNKNRKIIEDAILKTVGLSYKVECVVDKNLKIAKPIDHDEELLNSAKEVFEVEE